MFAFLIWPEQKQIEKVKKNSHGRCICGHGGFVLSVVNHNLIRTCPKCLRAKNMDTGEIVQEGEGVVNE